MTVLYCGFALLTILIFTLGYQEVSGQEAPHIPEAFYAEVHNLTTQLSCVTMLL